LVDVDKAVIARLRQGNENFEVLVDCDNALLFKSGKNSDISGVLAVETIYSDAKKGLSASDAALLKSFKTTDIKRAAEEIIRRGDIQITAEHKRKIQEQKKRRILDFIHRDGIDPRTGFPHPMTRLELAFEEAKIHIDEHKNAEEQIPAILKRLMPILPIAIERKKIELTIPPAYAAKGYSIVKDFGTIINQEWNSNGSWTCTIEFSAGMQNDLFDKVGSTTHGEAEIKILK
jgi:ribosome maturation protein SDO1